MAKASKVNPDGYVHTCDAKEYQRLRDQARMWQGARRRLGRPSTSPFAGSCSCIREIPSPIIEKMSAWTKPGGVVLAQEFDFGAMAVETTCLAMGEFSRAFDAVFRGAGGRQLPSGARQPRRKRRSGPLSTSVANGDMLIGVYDGLYAAGAELGLADPERASAFREDMADAATDGRYYCLTPVLLAAWKRIG